MMEKRSHNPYFNRWFSAIEKEVTLMANVVCHNPYFNRWFSAIMLGGALIWHKLMSQSLF